MARPEEKAKSMLNRWLKGKAEEGGSGLKRRRRPYMASECKDLNECDKWRSQVLRDIGAKVMEIQNSALEEGRIRELNDEINKLMKVKYAWEKQILKLGGPNYIKQAAKVREGEGVQAPGQGGGGPAYKYFGAARNLPGVKELFEKPKQAKKPRKTKHEILKGIDLDYYGYRDEDDGVLLRVEKEAEEDAQRVALDELEKEQASRGASGNGEERKSSASAANGEEDGDFVAYVDIPDVKTIEETVLEKKKQYLLAKYG
ncbi:pre-mRNA-splicing factor ISY1 [Chloropicon primus]|uniref:Pre-mRNA-splicing factor ISY1 n=1 Tax=Chloropicon primus TaxID=1764295 RepID=A0A5B8MDT8_9CHLO|nr:pre-mRNA-splicing factor ISY1 [Chloropicon primus]UPQ97812.1 pre-mRNA-splicing factor ISY1 [Chloropicon primus]|mmetsp:Transcript_10697/g.30145  ORF Transcript_10697/g.30145 Transcript_10697/m.30145 type:complete len:258 (+) Transcript_10697:206-979(+)|eukprot:QDZ18603.1 pre-mRNA-splicing factor ISY1 [Chloropicon primus]